MEVYYKFQSTRLLGDNLLAENSLEEDVSAAQISFHQPSVSMNFREFECEELRNDMSPPEIPVPVQDASPSTTDEDSQIRDLIHTHALDWWQCPNATHSSGGLLERMIPTSSYKCPRCKVPGHFIPTNGHPMFGIKTTKPPTGIPHSMLTAAPDASYALPNADFAVLGPNEAAFEKEIQGVCSVAHLSTGLYCPLCRAVMKDAVLASKCCFKSFCHKCIRDYIISNSLCICGATNVLADDFLPNKTLRDTIIWFLEFSNCRGANGGSAFQPQGTESARFLQLKKRDVAEFKIGFSGGRVPPIMSREESKGPKTTIKQKYDLERRSGGNMELYRDRNSSRKMTGKKNVLFVKSKSMSITPPELCTHDPEFMCTSAKRKVKHDDDYYEEYSHQPRKKVRILPDNVDLPPLPSQSTKKTISDWKYKANVLASITFPEGESAVFKKRKLGCYSSAVNGSSHHRSHCMISNKYHEDHRNTAAAVLKNSYKYYADHDMNRGTMLGNLRGGLLDMNHHLPLH